MTLLVQCMILLVFSIRNYLAIKRATESETRRCAINFSHPLYNISTRNIFFKKIILLLLIEMEVKWNTHKKYIYIYVYKIINLQSLKNVNIERPSAFVTNAKMSENNSRSQTGSVRKTCFARAIIDPCKAGIIKFLIILKLMLVTGMSHKSRPSSACKRITFNIRDLFTIGK